MKSREAHRQLRAVEAGSMAQLCRIYSVAFPLLLDLLTALCTIGRPHDLQLADSTSRATTLALLGKPVGDCALCKGNQLRRSPCSAETRVVWCKSRCLCVALPREN